MKTKIIHIDDEEIILKHTLKWFNDCIKRRNSSDAEFHTFSSEKLFWDFLNEIELNYRMLIILDLKLSRRNSYDFNAEGFRILENLRSHESTKAIPVVILSTEDSNASIVNCYSRGANAYICKGTFGELRDKFKNLLDHWLLDVSLAEINI